MNLNDGQEMSRLAACLKAAADVYGRPPLSGEAVKLFAMLLRDFDIPDVERALWEHMRTSPYMPKPSDIVTRLERGSVALEESIAIYERGEALKKHCDGLLRNAEMRIEKITVGPDGRPAGSEPFDAD